MAQELDELALFPLDTVVFPYGELRLHIFEPRYRTMISECLSEDRPFGIVLIRAGSDDGTSEPYLVGTAVRIIDAQRYDDGRMDIVVRGEHRFRIRRLEYDREPYLVGFVEPVVEQAIEDPDRAETLLLEARDQHRALIESMFANEGYRVEVRYPTDPIVLSFALASLLPMENLLKQRLLETTDTLERVEDLLPRIRDMIFEPRPAPFTRVSTKELSEWASPN